MSAVATAKPSRAGALDLRGATCYTGMCTEPAVKSEEQRRPLRICLIVRYAHIAGTEKHALLLASNINKNVATPHVLVLEDGELCRQLTRRGVVTTVIPHRRSVLHYVKVAAFLAGKKFDIVHCHSGGYVCIIARLVGVKCIVYTKHGIGATMGDVISRPFIRRLRDVMIDLCVRRYIALTRYDRMIMSRFLHISQDKIEVIPNGIDPTDASKPTKRQYDFPTIGAVGRLVKQKGLRYLIEAMPAIITEHRDLKLIIAGDGPEERSLKALAERLGVSNNVFFLGHVKNPLAVISQLDVFVLPSIWEGLPYVLLEAMLLKRPIVASRIFGISEIIRDGEDGILVQPRSAQNIADVVLDLLANAEKRRSLGEAGHNRVLTNYTLAKTIRRIEQCYLSVCRDTRLSA